MFHTHGRTLSFSLRFCACLLGEGGGYGRRLWLDEDGTRRSGETFLRLPDHRGQDGLEIVRPNRGPGIYYAFMLDMGELLQEFDVRRLVVVAVREVSCFCLRWSDQIHVEKNA